MPRVLITGANRGIGLELCRQFHSRGDEVVAVCRQGSDELEKLDVRVIDGIDVADEEALEQLRNALRGQRLDCLVNNAGILVSDSLDDLDPQAVLRQFRVNALGPLLVTRSLLPNLESSAKVAIVTSRVGSLGDNTSGGYYGYRMSKAAVNMAGVNLALELKGRGIALALLHPGMVATDMTGGNGVSVTKSAQGLIARIDELELENSGSFWHAEGYELPW